MSLNQIAGTLWSRWHFLAVVLGLTLGGVGCTASRTALDPLADLPLAWENQASPDTTQGVELNAWWTRFEDATLDSLVDLALAGNPDLAVARSRLVQAEEQRRISGSGLWPSLTASAGSNRSRSEDLDAHTVTFGEGSSTGIGASWQLDLFGATRAGQRATQAEWEGTREELRGARQSLVGEVAGTWFSYRAAAQSLDATRQSLALREESLELTRSRQQVGESSLLELRQEEASVSQARAQLAQLEQALQETGSALALLCDKPFAALDGLLSAGVEQEIRLQDLPAAGLPAESLRRRPDVRQAESTFAAALARREAAQRERLPSLSLSGNLSAESDGAEGWFAPDQLLASIAAGLGAPLFQAGALAAQVEIRREDETQAGLRWRQTVLAAAHEVENALTDVTRTAERRLALEEMVQATEEATELAMLQAEAGLADQLTRLDAQRSLLGAGQSLAEARAAELLAHANLALALGGGLQEESR